MQPSPLDAAATSLSWEWLVDLPHRLNVVVELLDDRQTPIFPSRSTAPATAIRRMITGREPALMSAVAEVLQSALSSRVVVDGFQLLCLRLASLGALVIARADDGDAPDQGWRDLEMVGSWVLAAMEASVTTPPNGLRVEAFRLASLQRILTEAQPRGSVRKVLGAFVEALGVWDDVRVDVYASDAETGTRFFRYVSPVGAPASPGPSEIDAAAIPSGNRMMRCSRADLDRLGVDVDAGDVLVQQIWAADLRWLLVCTGSVDGPEQVRLMLYADMLRESLNEVIAVMIGRVIAATRDGLPDAARDAAQAVLSHVTAAVGGHQSALVASSATGEQPIAVGNTDLIRDSGNGHRPDRLVVTSSDPLSVVTMIVERAQPRFTAVERALVEAGIAALHPRVQAAAHSAPAAERRRHFRPVDSLFDQLAAETVGAGQPASVIVVSVDAAALGPGVLYACLARIREHLRAGDFAGMLSSTEIAVLLSDASAEHAVVVALRLKQLLQSNVRGALLNPVFRTTTRSPESAFEGSLVGAARAGTVSVH